MVSVDLIAMVTSEASYGYERRLRAKRVMVTSEASNGRVQWHSYGGSFWSVLPHCSLRHPCDLTLMEEGSGVFFLTAHFVIPVSSLTSSSLCSHTHDLSSHPSHRYPWLLSRVISPKSSLTTHSHITRVTTHPILSVLTHTHTHCTHQVISSSSLATHSHHLCYHAHSSPRSLSPHFSECSHPSLVFSHSPSHIECHHTHSHILLTCVTTLSDLTSLVFWESVCSHFHGVVLSPSLLSHCLLSHTLSHPCHPCQHFHGVVLPPSLPTHCSERTCAPTHFISPHSRYKCITNASPTISHTLPPIMPPSPHHHLITSSYHQPPPIASSHSIQFIPPLHFTPNPPNRLLNPLQSQFIPITTIVAPHRLPNNIKPIQSRRWDKPQGLAGQSQLIPSQYPLHTKSSTKDCTDNTISFNTIQIVFLYPKRIKYSYVKYILSL